MKNEKIDPNKRVIVHIVIKDIYKIATSPIYVINKYIKEENKYRVFHIHNKEAYIDGDTLNDLVKEDFSQFESVEIFNAKDVSTKI